MVSDLERDGAALARAALTDAHDAAAAAACIGAYEVLRLALRILDLVYGGWKETRTNLIIICTTLSCNGDSTRWLIVTYHELGDEQAPVADVLRRAVRLPLRAVGVQVREAAAHRAVDRAVVAARDDGG